MSIRLKPEQERIIRDEIQRGRFRTAEEALDHALAALREESSLTKSNGEKQRKNLAQFLVESPLAGPDWICREVMTMAATLNHERVSARYQCNLRVCPARQ